MVQLIRLKGYIPMSDTMAARNLTELASRIASAYLSNNPVPVAQLPNLIRDIHMALVQVEKVPEPVVEQLQPAVPIKKSITPDYIVCLEDGKKLKMLKRHLATSFGLTPEQYRERWGLPSDYPMVAPNYANQRSRLAKQIGLGTRGRRAD
jgi:predicted transcriptional regulator